MAKRAENKAKRAKVGRLTLPSANRRRNSHILRPNQASRDKRLKKKAAAAAAADEALEEARTLRENLMKHKKLEVRVELSTSQVPHSTLAESIRALSRSPSYRDGSGYHFTFSAPIILLCLACSRLGLIQGACGTTAPGQRPATLAPTRTTSPRQNWRSPFTTGSRAPILALAVLLTASL